MAVQPGTEHFDFGDYADRKRWSSYWHQIDEVTRRKGKEVLIVGGGDGIVPGILRNFGYQVTVVDVVPELAPDVLADVRDLPFDNDSYDQVLCCQVLEHIPFDTVGDGLREMARVSREGATISLPSCSRPLSVTLQLGQRRRLRSSISLPGQRTWSFNGVHYWEIGAGNYSLKSVEEKLEQYFHLDRTYLVEENPYHRFFSCSAT